MTQQNIQGQTGALGSGGNLNVYTVPGAVICTPVAATVVFDGTGAAGSFIPCLTFKTQTGAIIARCPAPGVAAGDTAEVSWFQSVGSAPSGSGGSGVQLDSHGNIGGYLELYLSQYFNTVIDNGAGVTSKYFLDPGSFDFKFDDGTHHSALTMDRTAFGVNVDDDGVTSDSFGIDAGGFNIGVSDNSSFDVTPTGGSWTQRTGDINILALIGNIFLNLPTADPGVSGALWNNAGTVMVSP